MPSGNMNKLDREAAKKEQPEHIHSSEEIVALFKEIIGGMEFEEIRKLRDEKGLYLWDIKIEKEDGSVEYSYIRKGDYRSRGLAGGSSSETVINVIYFDKEGEYVSGTSAARFVDGKWMFTP